MTSATIDCGDGLPLTIPRLLRRRVEERGDREMLVCDDERMTYAQLDARSRRIARGLMAAGAGKGSHVGLLHPNGADFVVSLIAAARIGATVVPLSTFSTADELRWLIGNSDVGFLLAAPGYRGRRYDELLGAAMPELDFAKAPPLRSAAAPWLRRICFSGPAAAERHPGWSIADLESVGESIDDSLLRAAEDRVAPTDRFVIIHTSGSTSTPKGVMHSQGAVIRHMDNINQIRGFGPEDCVYAPSPWFWVAGIGVTLMATIIAGARIAYSNAVEPAKVLDFLERERPNTTIGYPSSVERLAADPSFAARDMSFLRRGNLYPIMPEGLRPRDPALRHGHFGMTEVLGTFACSGDETDQPESRRGSFGPVAPGFEGRIVDPDAGRECGRGEPGELWIRSPFMMDGYYGRPRSEVFDRDGWWHSGDLGHFDSEGFFHFKTRSGDMIKTLGANVAPREVEAVLRGATGGLPCHVIGIPDEKRGQLVVAVVISDRAGAVEEAPLREKLAAKLSSYKLPRRIVQFGFADLPLLSSGKTDLRALQQRVLERLG